MPSTTDQSLTHGNKKGDFVDIDCCGQRAVKGSQGYRRRYGVVQVATSALTLAVVLLFWIDLHQSIVIAHCLRPSKR